ncbi:hypothetical protein GQ457_11G006430 [Hibiscus cannabinus]
MEDLKKELKMGELKREILRNSLEQTNAQASSILLFTLQWKELEDHFDSIQRSIEKRLDAVGFRETEVETRMRIVSEREEEFGLKESELSLLSKKIEECNAEIKFKKEEIDLMQKLLEDCSSEFKSKGEELDSVGKSVEDCCKELGLKKEELCSVQKLISECCEKLEGKELELECLRNSIKECSDQLDVKQNELVRNQEMIEEQCKQLGDNERKQDSFKSLFQDYEEELEAKKEKYEALEKSVAVLAAKLDYSEKKLCSIDEKISDRLQELSSRDDDLDSLLALIVRSEEKLESTKEELKSVEARVREYSKDVELKNQEFNAIQMSIEQLSQELDSKGKQLGSVQISIEGYTKELEAKEEKLHSKEKQLSSVQIWIEGCTKQLEGKEEELHSKEKQLSSVQISIEGCTKQLEAKEEELHSKEKQLSSVQMSVQGCTKQLEAKEEELTSIKNSILECTKELESKQQQLESIQKFQENSFGVLESEEKQPNLVEKEDGEYLQEADVTDEHLRSLERSLEERLDRLETEKRHFEARVGEFELKEKQFDLVKKSVEQRSKEIELKEKKLTNALHSQVSSENPNSFDKQALGITNTESGMFSISMSLSIDSYVTQTCFAFFLNSFIFFSLLHVLDEPVTNQIKTENPENFMICNASEASTADVVVGAVMHGIALQSILNEQFDEPGLRKNEVLSALQMSPDPAKFVLDLMIGISSQQHKKKAGTGFEESVLKISVIMLEQLLQVSPHVHPNVKADALEFANEWKTKMKLSAENSLEILCFLQFVAAFGLSSSLRGNEIFKLLVTTAQHQQARNICQLLGFTNMIPEFVGSLVSRKQYIEAVRFICALDCKDKFPPKQLLDLFLDDINRVAYNCRKIGKNSPQVQQKATDEWITSLKSLIECVIDCKLESCMPVEVIENFIAELEKQKMNSTFSAVQPNVHGWTLCNTRPFVPGNQPSPVLAVQRQFQGGIYASSPGTRPQQQFQGMINASSTPGTRPQGPSNKRARTDGLVIKSYTPQVPTVLNLNIHPASLPGPGVKRNTGIIRIRSAANLEHSSSSATRQYLVHNKPKQQ